MRIRSLLAVVAGGALVVAACGSDDDAGTTTQAAATTVAPAATDAAPAGSEAPAPSDAPAEDAAMTAAKANVAKYTTYSGGIGVTIPLTGKPEKKTIAFLECDAPTCAAYITPGFKDATAALGWDLKVIPMKSTDPGPAVQQAIDAGVDYIASTGVVLAQFQPQADAAKAAGIPLLSCFATDAPSAESGLYMQCGDGSAVSNVAGVLADWAVVDSNASANVLILTIRDFPILVTEEDAYKAQLAKSCPDCKVDTLNVTLDDLIGDEDREVSDREDEHVG